MVEELAKDYANYLDQSKISKEINPIRNSIDEMLTRLDEFETVLTIIKNDSTVTTQQNLPNIHGCIQAFQELCKNIDNLEKFVNNINLNLNILEQHVSMAESELGTNELGITKLLKPIFNLIISGGSSNNNNNKNNNNINNINSSNNSNSNINKNDDIGVMSNSTTSSSINIEQNNSLIREYIPPEIFKTMDFFTEPSNS